MTTTTTGPNLYALTERAKALDAKIDEAEGISDEQLATEIAALEGDLDAAVDAACRLIKEYESRAAARKQESARIDGLAKAAEARAASMRNAIGWLMRERQVQKIETTNFNVSVRKSGRGKVKLLVDVADLPDDLVRIKREAKLDEIAALIASDADVPFAVLEEPKLATVIK